MIMMLKPITQKPWPHVSSAATSFFGSVPALDGRRLNGIAG